MKRQNGVLRGGDDGSLRTEVSGGGGNRGATLFVLLVTWPAVAFAERIPPEGGTGILTPPGSAECSIDLLDILAFALFPPSVLIFDLCAEEPTASELVVGCGGCGVGSNPLSTSVHVMIVLVGVALLRRRRSFTGGGR